MSLHETTSQKLPRPKVRVFLEGRYRKLVRNLPQTIFYCPECKGRRGGCARCQGYGKLTRDSVQELIARKVLPRFKGRKGKFHGAGREDLNVRMLGGGRPFVFEVVAPRNLDVDLAELSRAINSYGAGRLEVTSLLPVPRKRVAEIKETHCPKVYRALVEVEEEEALGRARALQGRALEVAQRTPKRVSHRRADKDRIRTVEILWVREWGRGARRLELEVRCQHGTYVKEWISGEDGRSRPSFAGLLACGTRCLALDVWDVALPPPEAGGSPSFETELSLPLDPGEDPWGLSEDLNEAPEAAGGTEGGG